MFNLEEIKKAMNAAPEKKQEPKPIQKAATSFADNYTLPKYKNKRIKAFRLRASAAHKLMTQPRTKADKEAGNLSQTAKSYLELWYKEQLYQRHEEIKSKYTQKGSECENESIQLISEVLKVDLEKNTERKTDRYFTGEPDIITDNLIIDVKNSFSFSSFPLLENVVDTAYYAQAQVYMHLFGIDQFKVIYTLLDMPLYMIESEVNKFCWSEGCEKTQEVYNYIRDKHTYSHLPLKLRYKEFDIVKDQNYINTLKDKVVKAKEYLKTLSK